MPGKAHRDRWRTYVTQKCKAERIKLSRPDIVKEISLKPHDLPLELATCEILHKTDVLM